MKKMFRVHVVAPGSRTAHEENCPIRLGCGKAISLAMSEEEARRLSEELAEMADKVAAEKVSKAGAAARKAVPV